MSKTKERPYEILKDGAHMAFVRAKSPQQAYDLAKADYDLKAGKGEFAKLTIGVRLANEDWDLTSL